MKLQEILEKISQVDILRTLFGATVEFNAEFERRTHEIGDAICKEKGITKDEASNLSPETELDSENVHKLFKEFTEWLSVQSPDLK